MNNFSQEEIKVAKQVRDALVNGDLAEELRSVYIAGEIVMWDELRNQSPLGANVLVEQINKITEASRLYGCSTDNTDDDALIAANGFNQCLNQVKFLVAQYNAVEPEKGKDRVDELVVKIREATYRRDNREISFNEYKELITKYISHFHQSQSPQTPIDREPEGIDGMGVDPL